MERDNHLRSTRIAALFYVLTVSNTAQMGTGEFRERSER
jgi:hypothetical protein